MFFLFFKKCNINIEILAFFFPLHQFFNKSCFSSLSINAKQKFWGVSHLLHMCVIFPKRISFWAYNMGPIQPKITQSYITLSAFKIFVNILAWYGVIIRHCHFSQFSKKIIFLDKGQSGQKLGNLILIICSLAIFIEMM